MGVNYSTFYSTAFTILPIALVVLHSDARLNVLYTIIYSNTVTADPVARSVRASLSAAISASISGNNLLQSHAAPGKRFSPAPARLGFASYEAAHGAPLNLSGGVAGSPSRWGG